MEGITALITGGAHGIGFGIASSLYSQGANVVIADINGERGQEAVERLEAEKGTGKVIFQTCDVSSWASQVAAFAGAKKAFGRIDLVFANAGIAQLKEFHDRSTNNFASTDAWKRLDTLADEPPSLRVIEVNLAGALYTVYAALAHFRAQGEGKDGKLGRIVVTGSNAMIYPFPCDTLYGTSKTGLLGTIRALAPRLESEKITINALAPAIVNTGLPLPPNTEKLDLITPMKTITDACKLFYANNSQVNGQVAECCKDRIVFRKFPTSLDEKARQSMNEFWLQDEIDSVLLNFQGQESF